MKFPLLLSITFLLLVLSSLQSQEKWRQLTAADGLSGNVVNQIYQTKNGGIWIGTKEGIDRYNGVFQTFFAQFGSSLELSSTIFETTTGQLIMRLTFKSIGLLPSGGTEILLFDGQEWNSEFDTDSSPIENTTTNMVLATSNDMILLGTNRGLFQYHPGLNQITDLKLGQVNVNSILQASDGSIWACATDQNEQRRLYRLRGGQWNTHLPDEAITTLYQSADIGGGGSGEVLEHEMTTA